MQSAKTTLMSLQNIHHLRENHLVLGHHHCLLRGTICPTFLKITILLHLQGHHLSSLAETLRPSLSGTLSVLARGGTIVGDDVVYDRQIVNATKNTPKK